MATTKHVISSVLVKEEGKQQKPMYYVGKRLLGAESRYLVMDKLALSLVHASLMNLFSLSQSTSSFRAFFCSSPVGILFGCFGGNFGSMLSARLIILELIPIMSECDHANTS
jgi:hypothetical protein